MIDSVVAFLRELKFGARSLVRTKGLTATVVLTLTVALGIGANTAIFSLVRGVLLRPLVNRDESRLIYIRQSAPGMRGTNANFSIPEITDLRSRVKTLRSFGEFSTVGFTMIGLGEPRSVQAGVVGGSYFPVMGLRPVLGRLLDAHDDGPKAEGAVVLTYRFWSTALKSDPKVLGKTVRLDSFVDARTATVVGVLEPCVPYPADTEIIANVVTSSHHLSAAMVTSRIHRMTELFARLAPGANLETARAELRSVYEVMKREHPEAYPAKADFRISAVGLRDQLTSGARTIVQVEDLRGGSDRRLICVGGVGRRSHQDAPSLEAVQTGLDTRHVLAVDVPVMHLGKTPSQVVDFYREATRRIRQLPGVQNVAIGSKVPWRDTVSDFGLQFSGEGQAPASSEEHPRAAVRIISPGFFATLGLPVFEGRDFNDADRNGSELVAVVSQSVAQRMFPKGTR